MKSISRLFTILAACLITCLILASCGHEHDFGDWKTKKEATCEKEGKMIRTCECGEEETKNVKKTKHVFGEWETKTPAGCEEDGVLSRSCECGEEETKALEMTGHTFGDWETTAEPTCEEDGQLTRLCTCGASETKKVKKIGHSYKDEVTQAAGCDQVGIITFTCENCGDSYTEEFEAQLYSATELYNMYLDSVGEVIVYDRNGYEFAIGSCFAYDDSSIVTNYHVIEDSYSATVTFGDEVYDIDKVLAYDTLIDVAVLSVKNARLTPGQFCEKTHSVGSAVYAFGSSQGLTATFSDGMITTASREIDGVNYVQHDAPISGGNSGGPLINEFGEIVGINTWTLLDSQNLNFAICISELHNLDFNREMTLAEVCEAESDAFADLVEYVCYYGDYDYSDSSYFLTVGYDYSDEGYLITRSLMYYEGDYELWLILNINDESIFILSVNEWLDGEYGWMYVDEIYYMEGYLDASTFTESSSLYYTDHTVDDAGLVNSIATLSATMAKMLLYSISTDYADLGITPADLGFINF